MVTEKRRQTAWCFYDWANSAFATSILAALLPVYFAKSVVPSEGIQISLLFWSWHTQATSLWAYAVSASLLLVTILAPFLGALADYSHNKKTFFAVSAYLGAFATIFLYGAKPGSVWYTLLFFIVAHVGFAGSEIFYNAFLPELAPPEKHDWLSGLGYAYGYLGGGLLLALQLAFLMSLKHLGNPDVTSAVRLCLASVGVWWAVFTLPALFWLPGTMWGKPSHGGKACGGPTHRDVAADCRQWIHLITLSLQQVKSTFLQARAHRNLFLFLLAFFFYNDGIQTVISMAAIYGATELNLSQNSLLGTLLLTQFVAFPGAMLFSKWAEIWQTKKVLWVTLFLWCGIVFYAYHMRQGWEFWMLGIGVGLVLGGSQALSRSFYSQMVPVQQSAEFFGMFSIGSKFASISGPFVFGLIRDITGSSRLAILSTLFFLVTGAVLLVLVRPQGSLGPQPEINFTTKDTKGSS
jgi:MFS transporter, UMF1 family